MNHKKINDLIKKYANGTASESEEKELTDWYRQTAYQDTEFPENEDQVYKEILENLNHISKPKSAFFNIRKFTLAASIAVFLGVGVFIYTFKYSNRPANTLKAHNEHFAPGGNRAILTLANGRKISLNNAANGYLANQGGVQIAKATNGQLVYTFKADDSQSSTDDEPGADSYNTIETPVGGQYQVVLPDRSKVWLNAQSSIRFPVSFNKAKERRVELNGEAYFEVEHDANLPFRVITRGAITEDIGTSFNIKAYSDEADTRMTLLTGSAKIMAGADEAILKPGEQANYTGSIKVSSVNAESVIAWKNGYFRFEDDKLEDIMRVISRWYNIRYVFQDQTLKNETYGAVTTRFINISSLLNLMEQTGSASFKVEGSNIIITRKKPN